MTTRSKRPTPLATSSKRASRSSAASFASAARASAFRRLVEKVGRLEAAGLLASRTATEAAVEFQVLCEGLGNFELRGDAPRLLPAGREEESWRAAFTTLVAGLTAGAWRG